MHTNLDCLCLSALNWTHNHNHFIRGRRIKASEYEEEEEEEGWEGKGGGRSKLISKEGRNESESEVKEEEREINDGESFCMISRSTVIVENTTAVSTTAHLCTSCTYFECLVRLHCQTQQN